jgi:hypothetical protein
MRATARRAFARVAWTACLALGACATPPTVDESPASRYALHLIGRQSFDHALQFDGTTVGGLSGIDYDPERDLYFLISDDRSVFAPTRFYTARLSIDADGFHRAALLSVVTLLAPDGRPYATNAADSEAIRFDARTQSVWWTSEGARKLGPGRHRDGSRLIDPFIRQSSLDGRPLGEVPLAQMFHITAEARGPRDNLVFEGLTLSPDGQSLWVSMEAPLLQDGPMATMTDGAWSRISRHDREDGGGFGSLKAQFAYRIDPIPSRGAWLSAHAQTGVSEILAIDATHFFVLERALVLGPVLWHIRLFEADVAGATDVKAIDSLVAADAAFTPIAKRLVLDFDTLGIHIDNLEGVCFGPTLPNGDRTLVFVSDDNFDTIQTTQLLAFEIVPR